MILFLDSRSIYRYNDYECISYNSLPTIFYANHFSFYWQVFSAFGPVQKIAMFDKNGGVQALIQYPGSYF